MSLNPKKATLRQTIIKMSKVKDKEINQKNSKRKANRQTIELP